MKDRSMKLFIDRAVMQDYFQKTRNVIHRNVGGGRIIPKETCCFLATEEQIRDYFPGEREEILYIMPEFEYTDNDIKILESRFRDFGINLIDLLSKDIHIITYRVEKESLSSSKFIEKFSKNYIDIPAHANHP